MKYYIIAGEASGDLHGSNLMKELKLADREAVFRCWGGDLMQQQGGDIVKHYRDLAFMGFAEVIMNLSTILDNLKFCKQDIAQFKPDVVVLIDYPGFNMRIAKYAKSIGIKVVYYISPQVWAWKQSRAYKLKKTVDRMLVILPFEKEFYQKFGMDVDFVGHPLLDAIADNTVNANTIDASKKIVALLPGSRKQEIETMLPIMQRAIKHFKEYTFVVAGAPSIPPEYYRNILNDTGVEVVHNKTYELLGKSYAALVTSGTATLETALFRVPEVVCYKGNNLSYQIARKLIKVKYISLVNLVMDAPVVTELIQHNLTEEQLVKELHLILNPNTRENIIKNYDALYHKLGGVGASSRAAGIIYKEGLKGR